MVGYNFETSFGILQYPLFTGCPPLLQQVLRNNTRPAKLGIRAKACYPCYTHGSGGYFMEFSLFWFLSYFRYHFEYCFILVLWMDCPFAAGVHAVDCWRASSV